MRWWCYAGFAIWIQWYVGFAIVGTDSRDQKAVLQQYKVDASVGQRVS